MVPNKEFNIQIPPQLLNTARRLGAPGERWLEQLPELLRDVMTRWRCVPISVLHVGDDSLLIHVDISAQQAVLKLGLPGIAPISRQARIYDHASGKGYPLLYESDPENNVLLMEKLGPQLAVATQMTFIDRLTIQCNALVTAWQVKPPADGLIPGDEWLYGQSRYCLKQLSLDGSALSEKACQVLEAALISRKEESDAPVLIHADCHARNVLRVSSVSPEWKLIDPEGVVAEKAADLGALVREVDEDSPAAIYKVCAKLSQMTGVSEQAIWDWGYIYRVSSGLHQRNIGNLSSSDRMFHIAECLAE